MTMDSNGNIGNPSPWTKRIIEEPPNNNGDIGNYDVFAPSTSTTTPNATVTGTSTTLVVTGLQEPDDNYVILCTPSWNTTWWYSGKTSEGFTLNFGTAPTADSPVDWEIRHQ